MKAFEMNDEFGKTLQNKMVFYSTESTETLVEVMRKLERVRETMLRTLFTLSSL